MWVRVPPRVLRPVGQYIQKEGYIIIPITKSEAFALRKQGLKDHKDIMFSTVKHKTYYLKESPYTLKLLSKLRLPQQK